MGVGLAKQDSKVLKAATEQLATIAGQQPSVRRARKSIAAFKLREGMPVGVAVTLRGERGYEFLDRLISIAIPRIRDFRGLNPRSFDGRGNYSMGVREQIIFPEIDYDAIDPVRGLDITITTTARQRHRGLRAARGVRHARSPRRAGPRAIDPDGRRSAAARAHEEAEAASAEPPRRPRRRRPRPRQAKAEAAEAKAGRGRRSRAAEEVSRGRRGGRAGRRGDRRGAPSEAREPPRSSSRGRGRRGGRSPRRSSRRPSAEAAVEELAEEAVGRGGRRAETARPPRSRRGAAAPRSRATPPRRGRETTEKESTD